MSGSTKFPALLRLSLIALFALPLILGIASSAAAATADVVSFNAYKHTSPPPLPITNNKIAYSYTATWSDSGRKCSRRVDWYDNTFYNTNLTFAVHDTTPVNSSGTDTDAPRSEDTGDYYKIEVKVYNVAEPQIVYASDEESDGDFY
jgi:hypothetical protein